VEQARTPPVISMAVGTHGQSDQCAPSRLFNSVIQYGGGLDVMVSTRSPRSQGYHGDRYRCGVPQPRCVIA
jgi:hypothetical protein